jgi:hypothetical protein
VRRISEALEAFESITRSLLNELWEYMEPYAEVLPDARFAEGLQLLVAGMLAARSPQATKAAAHAPQDDQDEGALVKRFYRLLKTARFRHREWLKVLCADARRAVKASGVERVLVALDPVNFEKAYAKSIEGISTVRKSTPPGTVPRQEARLTKGYPALICYTLNLPQPAIPYARLFSYETPDFRSENLEIVRAMRSLRAVLPERPVCLITDSVLDDQKMFAWADQYGLEFVTRATSERWIEIYNEHTGHWEQEKLLEICETFPGCLNFATGFIHAGKLTIAQVSLDWFRMRIPGSAQDLWALVAETDHFSDPLILITNRPVHTAVDARIIYQDWRRRPTIELYYRFVQEDGLDVEKIQVHKLERIRREFILILALSLFVLRLPDLWHPSLILWFRRLGSATAGSDYDWGGPYLLLYGIQRVLSAWSVLLAAFKLPLDLLHKSAQANAMTYG